METCLETGNAPSVYLIEEATGSSPVAPIYFPHLDACSSTAYTIHKNLRFVYQLLHTIVSSLLLVDLIETDGSGH